MAQANANQHQIAFGVGAACATALLQPTKYNHKPADSNLNPRIKQQHPIPPLQARSLSHSLLQSVWFSVVNVAAGCNFFQNHPAVSKCFAYCSARRRRPHHRRRPHRLIHVELCGCQPSCFWRENARASNHVQLPFGTQQQLRAARNDRRCRRWARLG